MIPSRKSKPQRFNRILLGVTGGLSAVVFIIDIYIPLGVSGSMVYVLFVMATYWKEKNITIAAGALGTLLTIAGFFFSVTSEYIIFSAINHIMAIIVIWATVWFVNNYKTWVRQIRQDYRSLFQAANDEILVFQLDDSNRPTSFLEVNDTACEILGYSRAELLEKSLNDITVADGDEINSFLDHVSEHGEIVFESRHLTKDGDVIPVELSIRLFTYNGRRSVISVGRDLRERHRLEQEILNASEQERQRIGRDLHDDLGQLLSVAKMTSEMLGRKMKTENIEKAEKIEELTGMIKSAGERVRTLSHGLVPLQVEEHGLNGALQELAGNVSKIYGTEIRYTGKQEISSIDHSSAIHIYRIVQEAINNAIKHGDASQIDIKLSFSGNYIILHVKDNGRGLPEPAEMSDGIGLRIMKFRANMIGGNFKIAGGKDGGTEVICRIPKVGFKG